MANTEQQDRLGAYIIVMGNPCDGFRFIGPFPDFPTALHYMETEHDPHDMWITQLDAPDITGL